jgi:hypothetical protein
MTNYREDMRQALLAALLSVTFARAAVQRDGAWHGGVEIDVGPLTPGQFRRLPEGTRTARLVSVVGGRGGWAGVYRLDMGPARLTLVQGSAWEGIPSEIRVALGALQRTRPTHPDGSAPLYGSEWDVMEELAEPCPTGCLLD